MGDHTRSAMAKQLAEENDRDDSDDDDEDGGF